MSQENVGWGFIDKFGTFRLKNPHLNNDLYFPLVNEAGMMSSITPSLHGDVKTSHNTFLTPPVTVDDLHNTRSTRNFWIHIKGKGVWSATGNSTRQNAARFLEKDDRVTLEAGFLWHKVIREFNDLEMKVEITNLVPAENDQVELMQVALSNVGEKPLSFTPTAAIPIFGRSADNLRDHRHVTSLLNRILVDTYGVKVTPTLTFDERGHLRNETTYAILGCEEDKGKPVGFHPVIDDFIGEGGSLTWPKAIIKHEELQAVAGDSFEGYEALGGLQFSETTLPPGQTTAYTLILTISQNTIKSQTLIDKYGGRINFEKALADTIAYWKDKLEPVSIQTSDPVYDGWMKWVSIQPILRQLYGNSFLPYHDYGRGGRGWRDLWQDLLALMLMEPENVRQNLLENFAGVRMDGSNATIIGRAAGEFKADRNNIPRVWMDHGAWPLLTTKLYLDQTGDLSFLLEKQSYFKDPWVYRSQKIDRNWDTSQGTEQRTITGETYKGTILEHLLIQHLTQFFNVGANNNMRLEGADWNDGMDMAPEKGESVAFTAFYAGNLRELSELVRMLVTLGVTQVSVAEELMMLLDTLGEKVSYQNPELKRERLQIYFEKCKHRLAGRQALIDVEALALDLEKKAGWLITHLHKHEWINSGPCSGRFNGYYDNNGEVVEGKFPDGERMTLTGQVFPLMGKIASQEQAEKINKMVNDLLFDNSVGGVRLNTDFKEVRLNLGRAFGYAYGTKENGAMFSHMAVMYAYSLYLYGFVKEGYKILDTIYSHSQEFSVSRMYPGIPEYFDNRGRGMYSFLTGAASWYLLTIITQVFGIRGEMGNLLLAPRLMARQFEEDGSAKIKFLFAGKQFIADFRNPSHLDFDQYTIGEVRINGETVSFQTLEWGALLSRNKIAGLSDRRDHKLEIILRKKRNN